MSELNIIARVFMKAGRGIRIKEDMTMERGRVTEDLKMLSGWHLQVKEETISPGVQVSSNGWKVKEPNYPLPKASDHNGKKISVSCFKALSLW